MQRLGGLGMMLFCIGGSLEASPDASWSVVLIPYGIMAIGLIIAVAAYISHNYYFSDDEDDYI